MAKQKKPKSQLERTKTIIEILSGVANIVLVIHELLKG